MSFLKHLLPGWKKRLEQKSKANSAILSAIDRELKEAEQEAIQSKVFMSLATATGEWLDEYGNIFGVIRKDNELDEPYRTRIKEYILLKRGTIPAIKDAIRAFLRDFDTYIEIYEPYTNIFYLNKSKLNGEDHLLGEYYTFAVIDVRLSRPFPAGVVDVINEFKPAGVKVRVTYTPNRYNSNASLIDLPSDGKEVKGTSTVLKVMNGMNDRIRGHLSLTERTRAEQDDSGLFTLNDSHLNSLDRLAGSFSASNPSYNLASYSTKNLTFTNETTMADVQAETESVSPDFYTRTGNVDDLYASHRMDSSKLNYLYFTLDVATYFSVNYSSYLREAQPNGVYTKETYASLMDNAYIQYKAKAIVSDTNKQELSIEALNLATGQWVRLGEALVGVTPKDGIVTLAGALEYLSTDGLIFTRLSVGKRSAITFDGGDFTSSSPPTKVFDGGSFTTASYTTTVDGGSTDNTLGELYDFHLHFFELGFNKEVAIRPTIRPSYNDITSEVTLSPLT